MKPPPTSAAVVDAVAALREELHAQAADAIARGQLPDATVARLRDTGVVRLLQPREWGGFEAEPREFFDAVMAAAACGASAWVLGVVGVHPWELALFDPAVQAEVWAEDPDTWLASSYMPNGAARRTADGYVVDGHWRFSSGIDHCDWVLLGAVIDEPLGALHVLVPRADFAVVDDSWSVMGLQGTGSKDVIVRDCFVPTAHTIETAAVLDGRASVAADRDCALYRMPWSMIFPVAVASAVIGIARAALESQFDALRLSTGSGPPSANSRALMLALSEAASDIDASRLQLFDNVARAYELVAARRSVPIELRMESRRDQVRGAWRAVRALDDVFSRTGGDGIRTDRAMQRLWRDAHAGLHHTINAPAEIYERYALCVLGQPPPPVFV